MSEDNKPGDDWSARRIIDLLDSKNAGKNGIIYCIVEGAGAVIKWYGKGMLGDAFQTKRRNTSLRR